MAHNAASDLIGGYIGSVGTASTGFLSGTDPGAMDNRAGGMSVLTRTVLHIAVFWVISIAVLLLLHKAGFRFSLTVG